MTEVLGFTLAISVAFLKKSLLRKTVMVSASNRLGLKPYTP
jgi:hypothetical protein